MSVQTVSGYAGDLTAEEAFRRLSDAAPTALIDVRTAAEWAYVGVPDLGALGRNVVFLEWQSYPSMARDPGFAAALSERLAASGIAHGSPLLFLCRSGARSKSAAIAMTAAGWEPCFNISDGFEGPLDATQHRNAVSGWRAGGLPWKQT
jgi:rhodanese-related sulfurtransferase